VYDLVTKLWTNFWYVVVSAANGIRKLFGKPRIGTWICHLMIGFTFLLAGRASHQCPGWWVSGAYWYSWRWLRGRT